jgi:hypothetical protein
MLTNNKFEKLSLGVQLLLKLSLVLAIFIAPFSVLLNKIFGAGYIYFAALPDLVIIISLVTLVISKLMTKQFSQLSKGKIDFLIWAYLAINLIYLLWGFISLGYDLSLIHGFLSSSRFALVYLAFRLSELNISDLYLRKITKFIILVVLVFGLIQFIYPNILSIIGYGLSPIKYIATVDGTKLIRAQSLLRGPNPYGAVLLIPLSLILFNFRKDVFNSILLGLIIVNLILTWSRSAWLGALIIIVIFITTKIKLKLKTILISFSATTVIGLMSLFIINGNNLSTILLHDKPGEGGSITSDQDRLNSYKNAVNLITKKPFGLGLNAAGPASVRSDSGVKIVENYFLQIFMQIGWIGGALFIAITCLSLFELIKLKSEMFMCLFSSGVGLALVGLTQPVWVDASTTFLWWSFFGIYSAKK